jgi:hypothetical protein
MSFNVTGVHDAAGNFLIYDTIEFFYKSFFMPLKNGSVAKPKRKSRAAFWKWKMVFLPQWKTKFPG